MFSSGIFSFNTYAGVMPIDYRSYGYWGFGYFYYDISVKCFWVHVLISPVFLSGDVFRALFYGFCFGIG
jgi:hypothetical protein